MAKKLTKENLASGVKVITGAIVAVAGAYLGKKGAKELTKK